MDFGAPFNIGAAAEAGGPLTICSPRTGEPIPDGSGPMVWQIMGRDAPSLKAAIGALARKNVSGELSDEDWRIQVAAVCVKSWPDSVMFNGAPLPCTPENALALLTVQREIASEQIFPFAWERTSFGD